MFEGLESIFFMRTSPIENSRTSEFRPSYPLSATFREYPGASFVEKKSKIYFLISDDVIHGRLLMTSHKSETTPVRLPIRHMTSIT